MGIYTITLPDVGEGIAEAELTEWNVAIGDHVEEDDVLGTVMTDKAAVEVPSTVSGTVAWLGGEPGDFIPIGGKFIQIEVEGPGNADKVADKVAATPAAQAEAKVSPPLRAEPESTASASAKPAETPPQQPISPPLSAQTAAPGAAPRSVTLAIGEKPLAAPSVRRRAQEQGIDLRLLTGSGPQGRILHEDLDAWAEQSSGAGAAPPRRGARPPAMGMHEVKVVGMRRKIAEKMALAKARIPHITIIEEVDVTALEDLRASLNARHGAVRGKLTLLPFVMRAIVTAVHDQPDMNAHYDDEAGVVRQFDGVHIGIATQTDSGLTVPVARHVESHGLWDSAGELTRLAEAARSGAATREELSGSTITITSLGSLGAIATTPIINHPEVAIVGINKMAVRPVWDGQTFQPRKMMNISCAFDHRVIDGWDAAVFVQALKKLLETPALMFIEE